jgi:citrate lyase beta subunit
VSAVLRRAALCVPASEPARIRKAAALHVDEFIVDLEDAVLPEAKDEAQPRWRAPGARPRRNRGPHQRHWDIVVRARSARLRGKRRRHDRRGPEG